MYGDALTTVARIKDRLGITEDAFDALFQNLILGVTARMEAMCGRRFIQGYYTEEMHDGSSIDGGRRRFLIVKNAPVQAITLIEYQTGSNSSPDWREVDEDTYHLDREAGILHFPNGAPPGFQNIRITYSGGFSGYSIGINNFWFFDITPTGSVDGENLTFTLPEAASQVIVYADGLREAAVNVTFTAGEDEFTLAEGRAPSSTIAVDYLRANAAEDSDYFLPSELVGVCEEVVSKLFKRRESEGKTGETFGESSITFSDKWFTDDQRAAIKNYRRGYYL